MGAKDITLRVIPASIAVPFIKANHYSRKVVNNSCLHFGAFENGILHGVMSFGSPLDKAKVIGLVVDEQGENAPWNDMLELNRMALDETLPKNAESRCISQAIRLIKKNAPNIKWILSFADGCQCGDGTIYRASNFKLTAIKPNKNSAALPSGEVIHKMTLESNPTRPRKELGGLSYYDITGGGYDFNKCIQKIGGKILTGFQLRYIYIIDARYHLACGELPFSAISDAHAGMYKGQWRGLCGNSLEAEQPSILTEEGGANPTLPLQ